MHELGQMWAVFPKCVFPFVVVADSARDYSKGKRRYASPVTWVMSLVGFAWAFVEGVMNLGSHHSLHSMLCAVLLAVYAIALTRMVRLAIDLEKPGRAEEPVEVVLFGFGAPSLISLAGWHTFPNVLRGVPTAADWIGFVVWLLVLVAAYGVIAAVRKKGRLKSSV